MRVGVSPRALAVAGLVISQCVLMILLKLAQKDGGYQFSPASAICTVEVVKFFLAAGAFARHVTSFEARQDSNANGLDNVHKPALSLMIEEARGSLTPQLVLSLSVLAIAYAANNQLQFAILTFLEPGVVHLFKSTATVITAVTRAILLSAAYSQNQWIALVLQVMGVSLVKLDGCTDALNGRIEGFMLMGVSVCVTAACSVWNEALLKGNPAPMPLQNMVLYAGGAVVNFTSYVVSGRSVASFFDNFDGMAMLIVLAYSCVGLMVTFCYKYADAVLKTLSSGIATVILLAYTFVFYGTSLSLTQSIGAAITLIATYAYTIAPSGPSVPSYSMSQPSATRPTADPETDRGEMVETLEGGDSSSKANP